MSDLARAEDGRSSPHERDLAAYYDQDASARAVNALDADRIDAREEFLTLLRREPEVRLLEIGTGVGRDSAAFVESGIDTYGVDLSLAQAQYAARHGVRQVVGSVRLLPFTSKAFGAVWSMSVLMHVPNREIELALGEVRRVLKLGGIAAIGVWGGADVEQRRDEDPYRPARLFSRRSDDVWSGLLQTIGTVESFRTWAAGADDWWYQFAYVRRAN
jgi:SAM-dependent methyltransferase